MAEKDSLVSLSDTQKDPYYVRGKDFPVSLSGKVGDASGKDELCTLTETQAHPKYNESDGAGESGGGTPSVWGKGGKAFSVSVNAGEGGGPATSASIEWGVDLASGQVTPSVSTERD